VRCRKRLVCAIRRLDGALVEATCVRCRKRLVWVIVIMRVRVRVRVSLARAQMCVFV
jgi:hypothetical protein